MSNRISNIKNAFSRPSKGKGSAATSLSSYITPVQLQRLSIDVKMWREAYAEAERAYFPHRVKMQQIFIDTILNGHVNALMERRKDLTLLRDFEIVDQKGTPSEVLTEMFKADWFSLYMGYSLDALFFGYSLIQLGDIVDNDFPDLSIIKRWHISPDRFEVTKFISMPSGEKFLEKPYCDWSIWVPTPSETGASSCGYGMFAKIALYEIFLRNTLGYNAEFVEMFSQPYRWGKTTKTTESERAEFAAMMQNLGSAGWAITDPTDEIQFLETQLGGTGWKGYENLELRCEKKVSKIILGHADAVDSTPGKLGSGQGGSKDGSNMDGSPVQMALNDKQTKDGRFITSVTNKQLFPKLRNLGFTIPEGFKFQFKNDQELEEFRKREDQSNLVTAQIAQTMKSAGLQYDETEFEKRTGIKTTKIEIPQPLVNPNDPNNPNPGEKKKKPLSEKIKNKLNKIYEKPIK